MTTLIPLACLGVDKALHKLCLLQSAASLAPRCRGHVKKISSKKNRKVAASELRSESQSLREGGTHNFILGWVS